MRKIEDARGKVREKGIKIKDIDKRKMGKQINRKAEK